MARLSTTAFLKRTVDEKLFIFFLKPTKSHWGGIFFILAKSAKIEYILGLL
jgi:hypothetical protein